MQAVRSTNKRSSNDKSKTKQNKELKPDNQNKRE